MNRQNEGNINKISEGMDEEIPQQPIWSQQQMHENKINLCQNVMGENVFHKGNQMDEEQDPNLIYFYMFFSPKQMAQSIQRRNDNLEMLSFEKCSQEPDDVYNRRKKKVNDLISKQEQQLQIIKDIRRENYGKYMAIIEFVKLFCIIKQKLKGVRTDYYSNKTFCAIKNANEEQLKMATRTVTKMYQSISLQDREQGGIMRSQPSAQKMLEFLILPRFLISKQKINRLSKDEQLQNNFLFMINHECLGHYNNEANKKMPEEYQMSLLMNLMKDNEGREKFKKICSINHGNKFRKDYEIDYYCLYQKSLGYLRALDNFLKKGKNYSAVKKDLQKMKTEDTFPNSSYTSNQSGGSNKWSSSHSSSFKQHGIMGEQDEQEEQLRDILQMQDGVQISSSFSPMKKNKVRKLMSVPVNIDEEDENPKREFKVKKHSSANFYAENIILIPPPNNNKEI